MKDTVRVIWTPIIALSILTFDPSISNASYSPPLTRVRIDQTRLHHTPSYVFASQTTATNSLDINLMVNGLQYLGQFESRQGYGIQLGATLGTSEITGTFNNLSDLFGQDLSVSANGILFGWQARAYYMLWESEASENQRPHAFTSFINVRGLIYDAEERGNRQTLQFRSNSVSAGIGAMAEFSIHEYVSICPYAWLTPNLNTSLTYGTQNVQFDSSRSFNLRNPLIAGVDIWIYPFPDNWEDHISLSFLGSFIDTEDKGENLFAGVIGYTF